MELLETTELTAMAIVWPLLLLLLFVLLKED